MLRETLFISVALASVILCNATVVNKCSNDLDTSDVNEVEISNCVKPPCILKKGTRSSIQIKFTPNKDVPNLKSSVFATLLNVPLPFIGVDGTDACAQIYNVDGSKASCPLKKNTEYVYKNEFPILTIYPSIFVTVQYALVNGNDKITCFKVGAMIES